MSIQRIVKNIENNIQGRYKADKVLQALELITRMPRTFGRLVDAGSFFATHHHYDECEGCDDCYSGDTEFEHTDTLARAARALFSQTVNEDGEDDDSEDEKPLIVEQLPMNAPRPSLGFLGLKNPVRVNDNLLGFLREADFGSSDPSDPESEPLNLLVTENSICAWAILTLLFTLYTHQNKMQKDPNNRQFLTATPLMHKWFEDTFKELQARPNRSFDPEKFRYVDFQIIISLNVVKKDTFTEEELDNMYEQDVLDRLEQDIQSVRTVLNWYRHKC